MSGRLSSARAVGGLASEGHDGVVLSVVASQKGGLLASTAQDDPARVWLPDFTSIVISGAEEETCPGGGHHCAHEGFVLCSFSLLILR